MVLVALLVVLSFNHQCVPSVHGVPVRPRQQGDNSSTTALTTTTTTPKTVTPVSPAAVTVTVPPPLPTTSEARIESAVAEQYSLVKGSLGILGQPRYEYRDFRTSESEEEEETVAINGSVPLNLKSKAVSTTISKNSTVALVTIRAKCNTNLPNTTYITDMDAMCTNVVRTLEKAVRRIQAVVLLVTPINIDISFSSFCLLESNNDRACEWGGVLGAAAPSSWNVFDAASASRLGLDPDYMYPSSLARQYAPNDKALVSALTDITASFNADAPWWFPTDGKILGEGSVNGGSSGPPLSAGGQSSKLTKRKRSNSGFSQQTPLNNVDSSTSKIYDFEQVAIHEILHGMGFISSWYSWMGEDTLVPGFQITRTETNGTITRTFSNSYIFDKYLADSRGGIWMKEYADAIRQEAVRISRVARTSRTWDTLFRQSPAWTLAKYIRSAIAVTSLGLVMWYPAATVGTKGLSKVELDASGGDPDGNKKMRFAVIHSSFPYSTGSTLNHLDGTYYSGTGDFLMRPFATSGTGLDAYVPWDQGGPIGPSILGILRGIGYVTSLGLVNS
ncbi:hypothetical protein HDV05_004905 [Chytridiales sp. JEL 0842]|nr:hypothetical protein HDV05_004905 [Chytridiales sp. JEL 0842]